MLIGATTYDDNALVPPAPYGEGVATNLTAFHLEIRADWPDDDVARLLETYSPVNYGGSLMNARSQYRGDARAFCDARQFASYVAEGLAGSAFLYQFGALTAHDPVALRGLLDEFDNADPTDWATSGTDVVALLGTYNETASLWWYDDAGPVPITDAEQALSRELQARWAAFARTGSPNDGVRVPSGWTPVAREGPNRDGHATETDQFFFSRDRGAYMFNSAALEGVVDRCRAFPDWEPFSVITESPTYEPTTTK